MILIDYLNKKNLKIRHIILDNFHKLKLKLNLYINLQILI